MYVSRLISISLPITLAACTHDGSNAGITRKEFISWAQDITKPLSSTDSREKTADMVSLEQIIGEALVEYLGKSRYDTREHKVQKPQVRKVRSVGIDEADTQPLPRLSYS